jgi:hypothetical protein
MRWVPTLAWMFCTEERCGLGEGSAIRCEFSALNVSVGSNGYGSWVDALIMDALIICCTELKIGTSDVFVQIRQRHLEKKEQRQ